MYDNAAQASIQLGASSAQPRPLESLAVAAQRVNTAVVRVQSFIDRWHGAKPEANPAGGLNNGNAVQTPHRESLERLFSAIDRLDDRLDSLDQIG